MSSAPVATAICPPFGPMPARPNVSWAGKLFTAWKTCAAAPGSLPETAPINSLHAVSAVLAAAAPFLLPFLFNAKAPPAGWCFCVEKKGYFREVTDKPKFDQAPEHLLQSVKT